MTSKPYASQLEAARQDASQAVVRDLERLGHLAENVKNRDLFSAALREVYLHHLRVDRIPSAGLSAGCCLSPRELCATWCLHFISQDREPSQHRRSSKRPTPIALERSGDWALLVKHQHHIWAWVQHLAGQFLLNYDTNAADIKLALLAVLHTLDLANHSALCTKDAFSPALVLWVTHAHAPKVRLVMDSATSDSAIDMLQFIMLQALGGSNVTDGADIAYHHVTQGLRSVVAFARGDIVAAVFTHLELFVTSHHLGRVFMVLCLVLCLTESQQTCRDPPMITESTIESVMAAWALCENYAKMDLTDPAQRSKAVQAAQIAQLASTYVDFVLADDLIRWLPVVIRSRLLHTLHRTGALLQGDWETVPILTSRRSHSQTNSRFTNMVLAHLWVRPVFQAVVEAEAMDLLRNQLEATNRRWLMFLREENTRFETCANPECVSQEGADRRLKMCSGCKEVAYCARLYGCQRQHWRADGGNHRATCMPRRFRREHSLPLVSAEDIRLAESIAGFEIASQLPHIFKLCMDYDGDWPPTMQLYVTPEKTKISIMSDADDLDWNPDIWADIVAMQRNRDTGKMDMRVRFVAETFLSEEIQVSDKKPQTIGYCLLPPVFANPPDKQPLRTSISSEILENLNIICQSLIPSAVGIGDDDALAYSASTS